MPKEFAEGDLFMLEIRGGWALGHISSINDTIVTGVCEEVRDRMAIGWKIPRTSISIAKTDPRLVWLPSPDKVSV